MTRIAQFTALMNHAKARVRDICVSEDEYDFIVETRHGNLKVSFDPGDFNSRKDEPTITAFCHFRDPKALQTFGLDGNQFSGKWNHHCLDRAGIDCLVDKIAGFRS